MPVQAVGLAISHSGGAKLTAPDRFLWNRVGNRGTDWIAGSDLCGSLRLVRGVRGGALYLGFLINRFRQNARLALAAFNAGEDAVDRNSGQIPPFIETLEYVPKVLKIYQALSKQQHQTTLRNAGTLNHDLDLADSQGAYVRSNPV